MTLQKIRRGVSAAESNQPAPVPNTAPQWAIALDGSRYVSVSIFPRTIDELRTLSREYGEAAIADLRWTCVTVWLMNQPHEIELRNSCRVASVAVRLVHEHDRQRLGWPRHDGGEQPPSALDFLSPDARLEAERVAAETLSDWEKAGKPFMGQSKIKRTYQYLVSCPAFSSAYVRPLNDNEEQEWR